MTAPRRDPDLWVTLLPWAGIVLNFTAIYVLEVRTAAWLMGRPPNWAAPAVTLTMPLWLFPIIRWDERERFGGRERWAEYRTALRTGVLPTGADRDQWLPRLSGRMARARGARRVARVMSVVLICLWVTLVIAGRMGWEGWLVGPALVLALALSEARGRWICPRIELLIDQLPSVTGETAG